MNYARLSSPRCVSLGQFYRYLVCIHHGTRRRTTFKFHHNDDEDVKDTRRSKKRFFSERSQRVVIKKKEHINVPSVSAARTNASSFVFEGEKGVFMVRKWFKMRSRGVEFCEV